MKKPLFWLALILELVSWELVLLAPHYIWYWLGANLVASLVLAYFQTALSDRLILVVFNTSVFYWLLWLDLGPANYLVPVALSLALFYWLRSEESSFSLGFFLAGTFFSASVAFGLITVLGWPLWLALLLFLLPFAVLSGAVLFAWPVYGYLALLMLAAESFSVLGWLPFSEATLGLLLTLVVLAAYDLLKYFIAPELAVRRVLVKKFFVYAVFLLLILISTPWL